MYFLLGVYENSVFITSYIVIFKLINDYVLFVKANLRTFSSIKLVTYNVSTTEICVRLLVQYYVYIIGVQRSTLSSTQSPFLFIILKILFKSCVSFSLLWPCQLSLCLLCFLFLPSPTVTLFRYSCICHSLDMF